MKRLLALILAAGGLAAAAPVAGAADAPDQVPAPQPIVVKLGPTPVVQLSDGGGGLPYLGSPTSYNAGSLVQVLTQYHDTGVYDGELALIDGVAARWLSGSAHKAAVRARTARRGHGHGHEPHGKKQAIVFDVDETLLSNYSAIVADGFVYGPKSQAEATDEIGKAIKPSLDLFNLAKAKGITVFLITGRPEAQRAPTEDNLKREGFTGYQQAILKPAGFAGTTVAYKSGARAAIEQQGYHIVASVGDQYSDLAGGHEDRGFKLPNPFYYLP